jgi:vacuolar protein 8
MTCHGEEKESVVCLCVAIQRQIEEVDANKAQCSQLKASLVRLEVAVLAASDDVARTELLSDVHQTLLDIEKFVKQVIEKEKNDLGSSTIFTSAATWLLGQRVNLVAGVQSFTAEIDDIRAQIVEPSRVCLSADAIEAARGCVESARGILQQGAESKASEIEALQALDHLSAASKDPQLQLTLVAAGLPELLVNLLKTSDPESPMLVPAAVALGRLPCCTQVTVQFVEEQVVPALLQLLDSTCDSAQCSAAAGLSALVCSAAGFVALGCHCAVVRLLNIATGNLQVHVTAILRGCYSTLPRDVAIESTDFIPGLVRALSSERRVTVENAAWLLWQCASQPETRAAVAAAGAVPQLVRLLSEGSREAKVSAARAVHSLSADSSYDALLSETAVAEPLVQLLRDGSDEARLHAAAALKNLAANADLRTALLDAGALPIVRRVLLHSTAEVRCEAIGALHNLSIDEAACSAITEVSFLQLVVDILLGERGYLQESAAGVLQNVTMEGDSDALLLAMGVLPALVRLLSEGTDEGKGYAAGVLSSLCGDAAQVPAVVRAGALPLLVQILKTASVSDGTRECVAEALCAIAEDAEYRAQMRALGVASAAEIGYTGDDVW